MRQFEEMTADNPFWSEVKRDMAERERLTRMERLSRFVGGNTGGESELTR